MRKIKFLFSAVSLLVLVLAGYVLAPRVFSQDSQGKIRGLVTSADGKPMEGVTVTVRGQDEPMATTVFTNEHGVYVFPPLKKNSKYNLMAQAMDSKPRR